MSPFGRLCSLPRNRPVAWFPASARWHVFSAVLRLPRYFGCPPWATHLTRSLPLSRFGPTFGWSISTFPKGLDSADSPLRSPENLQTKDFFSLPLNATRFAPFAQGIWAVIDPTWPLNSEAVCGNLGKKGSVSQWVYGFK